MAEYTLRNVKGSELTFTEVDNNFIASRSGNELVGCSIIAPISGVWFNQAFTGENMTAVSVTANTIKLSPLLLGWDTTIDQVGFWQTSSGSQSIRILIYSSDANGLPETRLNETATITTSGSGEYTENISQIFNANVRYWVGTHSNGTQTFRGLGDTNLKPLGIGTGLNTTAISDHIGASVAFGSAPATWTFAASQLGTGGVVSIGFRPA